MQPPITVFEARARVLAASCPELGVETVPLAEAAGRYLAMAAVADGPWPATDRSAMDGFALAAGIDGVPAGTTLPVVGQSLAGSPFEGELPAGRAIRIMTGAVVPPGADAVVPVEQTSGFQAGGFEGENVTFQADVAAGANIRPMGSEIAAGTELLAAGQRIGAAEVGALAVLGHAEVRVRRRVRVGIVATGDEVVPVEATPEPFQVRESNSWALAAQVHECGGEPVRLGIAPDEPAALRAMLADGLARTDVVVTIGGISKGTHDLVHGTLQELGVATVFHGIQLKPGKPTYFGQRNRGDDDAGAAFCFGLPGNPASSFTVFDLLVRPMLQRLAGGTPGDWELDIEASGPAWRANRRLQALPARLLANADGPGMTVRLTSARPSGDPFSLLRTNAYALIPADTAPAGGDGGGPGPAVHVVGRSRGVELP
ncbi:MAG: molybdopterin molybdotransferase MoeA [bacterium]|nr:molybdopterin molybdotransferase MoeA [bacterium]